MFSTLQELILNQDTVISRLNAGLNIILLNVVITAALSFWRYGAHLWT